MIHDRVIRRWVDEAADVGGEDAIAAAFHRLSSPPPAPVAAVDRRQRSA
jgi:hypothetical protein